MSMTLEKILQSQGFGSRKFCRDLILKGRVQIENIVRTNPNTALETEQLYFQVDKQKWQYYKHLYIALHKPSGFECSHQPQHHPSIFTLFPQQFIQRGLQCVGRLDHDTTGLLLLSDDGTFIHQNTSPRKKVPKVYEVKTAFPIENNQLNNLISGVQLRDETGITKALICKIIDEYQLKLVISEGKYHQVRRMITASGNHVEKLHRSAIGNFTLEESLPIGQWKILDEKDLKRLNVPVC